MNGNPSPATATAALRGIVGIRRNRLALTIPPRLLMRSPLIGGFVPRGALRADGTPHPYAGTGFGIGQAHRFPFRAGRFSWGDPERVDLNEVYQLAWDGQTFTTRRTEIRAQNAGDRCGSPIPAGPSW